MAETKEKDDFEFEIEGQEKEESAAPQQKTKVESKGKPEQEDIEVVDDTPDPDKGRRPAPPELVKELEEDELEEYSEKVKNRLINMKRVWHDERREKERALREQQEAIDFAKKMLEENKRLKQKLSTGEQTLIDTTKSAAELEFEMAKRAYKEAYDTGDADQITDAQTKLAEATWKVQKVKDYKPTLQTEEVEVKIPSATENVSRLDSKTEAWQQRNPWWGKDEEMTALALGYHQKLEKQYGVGYVGTDDYWSKVDETMRKRFPDYDWGDEPEVRTTNGGGKPVVRAETKPATVVAPATRSTSSKKIVLKQSEVDTARRLGISPEAYAREKRRLENLNG